MDGWKTSFLLGRPIFRCYVSFREGGSQEGKLPSNFRLTVFMCFFLAPFPKTLSFLQAQRDPNGSVEACVNVDLVSALEGADKVFSMLLVFTSKKPTGTKWASATCGA